MKWRAYTTATPPVQKTWEDTYSDVTAAILLGDAYLNIPVLRVRPVAVRAGRDRVHYRANLRRKAVAIFLIAMMVTFQIGHSDLFWCIDMRGWVPALSQRLHLTVDHRTPASYG
jgi:hypothetical protein